MGSKDRRETIEKKLNTSKEPLKGNELAKEFGVTRQVIVKDIAILRAEGKDIIATPEGYIINSNNRNYVKKIMAICHKREEIEEELKVIIKYGGIIEDVIVEHPLYGEIKAMLMIKTLDDMEKFMKNFKEAKAEPLSTLTGGVHLHTVCADTEEVMKKITEELRVKGFLIAE